MSKIQSFVDMNPFGKEDRESWENCIRMFSHAVISFSWWVYERYGCVITELPLLISLVSRARGDKDQPRVIVLDESKT